jgi:hypothetical protein
MACLPALLRKAKVLLTQEQKLWRSPSEITWKVVLPSQLSQHNCAHQSVILLNWLPPATHYVANLPALYDAHTDNQSLLL